MKTYIAIISIIFFTGWSLSLSAQNLTSNYSKTPDELLPYGKFRKAYKYFFTDPVQPYRGPGREKPIPTDVKSVLLGFLGPLEGSYITEYGKQMLQGTTLAIEEANARGGYKGAPFELAVHNDVGLWGASANRIVNMDDQHVWAILGSIDDIVTHVAIRVALKLEIPMMITGDPDPTLTETNIPWVIRVIPDDRQSQYMLVNYIYRQMGFTKVAMLRVNNRYGRVGTGEFKDAAERIGHPVICELRFMDRDTVFTEQLQVIKKTNPEAIMILGDPKELGLIVKQIRAMEMKQPIFAGDRSVNTKFISIAGKDAEGIVTTCQYNPDTNDPKYLEFKKNYKKRFGMDPDVFAAHAYDGMNILIKSIRIAGLNRALIRDILLDRKTFQNYHGVSGPMYFDPTWNNIRQIYMAEVRQGKFHFSPAEYKTEQ
ncbi:MAG TPA: ABC transporter substrate-binding protein [Cyclobacteriaceae bacterium]|nr:ABC transporter substrate-binding protein [Cyclobacteriaceae bacterium]